MRESLLKTYHSKRHVINSAQRENRWGYLFIAPWILGFLIFTLFPMVFSAILSFSKWNIVTGTTTVQFVGMQNYFRIFHDEHFYNALGVTLKFCLLSIPLYQILPLALALLLNMKIVGVKYFRVLYFLPSIIPAVAVALIWSQIFNEDTGILNQALSLFGISGPAWLSDPQTALYALVIMGIWGVGSTMIIYLSGLQGVDKELYEASEIDGAGFWSRFIRITLPLISPTIFFNIIMAVIGSFQYFTQAFILGSPMDSTLFYNLYIYNKAFVDFEMGYAAALAWIMFIIIMFFTVIIIKGTSFWVFYQNDDKI